MTRANLLVLLSLFTAAAPVFAASHLVPGPSPSDRADTLYCLRVQPATGSLIETVQCWTRAEWDAQGVDVDKEWAREGVAIKQ